MAKRKGSSPVQMKEGFSLSFTVEAPKKRSHAIHQDACQRKAGAGRDHRKVRSRAIAKGSSRKRKHKGSRDW